MSRYPASPPPLSNQDAYTTWPGGVDPTARLYDSVGGAAKRRRGRGSTRRSRSTRRHRKQSTRRRRR